MYDLVSSRDGSLNYETKNFSDFASIRSLLLTVYGMSFFRIVILVYKTSALSRNCTGLSTPQRSYLPRDVYKKEIYAQLPTSF
jgi:hypothetical protein